MSPSFHHRFLCFLVGVALLTVPGDARSQDPGPDITGVWGAPTDGGRLTLLGSGFGEHTLDVESSLGPQGWIERARDGQPIKGEASPGRWGTFATKVPAFVSSTNTHSGRRAIDASIDRGKDGDWQKVLHFQHPEGFASIYATWWVWFQPEKFAERTQWKMWRVNDDCGRKIVSDNCASPYANSYWNPDPARPEEYVTIFHCSAGCEWPAQKICTENVVPDPWYEPRYGDPYQYAYHNRSNTEPVAVNLPEVGAWSRMEFFLAASEVDSTNGRYWLAIDRPGEPRRVIDNWVDGLLTHSSGCCRDESTPWKHFVLQGFFDDNGGEFEDEEAMILYDDIYLQFGTAARVELGNAPEYSSCTTLEVQEVVDWSPGEIAIGLNHGSFGPGQQVFLFVVREDGRTSTGMPVSLD